MKKTIDFAEHLRLPMEVASSPVALLAQRGRGKTRAAKKRVEAFRRKLERHTVEDCSYCIPGVPCDIAEWLAAKRFEAIGRRKEAEAVLAEARRHG